MATMTFKTDKARFLDLLDADYQFLERTVTVLTPEQWHQPTSYANWTPKDTLQHLTRWIDRSIRWIEEARLGIALNELEPGYAWSEMDALNDLYLERDRDLPLETVQAGFRAAHARMTAFVEVMPEHELLTSTHNGCLRSPVAMYLADNSYGHYIEHIVPLRKWMLKTGILRI